MPEASALPADRVGSLRTLRQIVEAIGVPASAPAPAPAQTPTASPSKLERRILLATALPPLSNGKPFPLSKGAKVMVFSNGGSLAGVLRSQADQRLNERFARAERLALEAPVKLLAPLILCIFPCTFLVLAFPVAIRFLESP